MWQKLFKPIDIAPLVFFRVFGCALMTMESAGHLFRYEYRRHYLESDVHFSYYFFQWLEPISDMAIYMHMSFNILMGICVTLGLFYRWTTILWCIGETTLFLMEKSVYINHTYLYALLIFLLFFMPANRAWSLDVKRNPSIERSTVPAWTVFLIIFQMSLVYFFAGIAKINPDWFQAQPMTHWLAAKKDWFLIAPILTSTAWAYLVSYGGVIFDLFIVPALIWKKTRKYAFITACMFHVINVITFGIGSFPWLSIVATSLFFAPAQFRKIKFFNKKLPPLNWDDYQAPNISQRKLLTFGIASYMIIQLLIPARQWMYPGNISWTENGHNFSWHMMLRKKMGSISFRVVDPVSGETWRDLPRKRLTRKQYYRMMGKPDMIIEYAHFLVNLYKEQGYPNVEVYADANIILNARKMQRLVDETVDLAKEEWSLLPYNWVIPLEDGPIVYKKKN